MQADQVGIVAYSWGAYLALTYLSLNPDHVDRIFLINPLVQDSNPKTKFWHRLEILPFIGKAILFPSIYAKSYDYLKKMFSPQPIAPHAEKKLKPFLQSASVWQGNVVYKQMLSEFPLSEDLKSFPVPVHALFGNNDLIAPCLTQLPYLQNLVKFTYKTVDQAGHALPWTNVPLINDEIRQFFSRVRLDI